MRYFPRQVFRLGVLFTAVWILFNLETARAASPIWAPPPLDALIEEALDQNQEIKSLEAQVESLKEEVVFAGSLEDLRLGLAALNVPTDTFSFSQEPMTQKQISIAQKIPWFGKLDLKSQRASLKVLQREALLDARRLELAKQIALAFFDLGFIYRSIEINQKLTEIVNQLLRAAEVRYATGRGLQQDVLQAQVELSKLLEDEIGLKKRRRTLTDQINELLNREQFMAVEPQNRLDFLNLRLDSARITSKALEKNPQIQAKKAEIGIAEVDTKLARKDYWPDMDVMLAYGQRDEDMTGRDLPDFFSAQIVMNIPLWYKTRQDPKLTASLKDLDAAEKSHRNLLKRLPFRVDALITEINDLQKNYKLFTDALLLQADQWARSSQIAYEVGSIEFNTMLNAQIRLLQFELQAEKYLFDIYRKRAELEELLGGPIP